MIVLIAQLKSFNPDKMCGDFIIYDGAIAVDVPICVGLLEKEGISLPVITNSWWVLAGSLISHQKTSKLQVPLEQECTDLPTSNLIAIQRYSLMKPAEDKIEIWKGNNKITISDDKILIKADNIELADATGLVLTDKAELSVTVKALNTPTSVTITSAGQNKTKA